MILLDTNVLSEFMRPQPSRQVVGWLDAQAAHALYTRAVSRSEIELHLALMPAGRRQAGLSQEAQGMFEVDFAGRCLPFDETCASYYARLVASRTRMGRAISVEDAQIAAIALARGMALATRNTPDFVAIDGLTLIDPWVAGT
ncbi:MAG: type II toxin-antitoxin system VapC family toxin [Betaproteobacteria bacterium]|nr:MAG: type II toxin-antitoxin system VapC family toxin [Betaproteobacteria bacterium]